MHHRLRNYFGRTRWYSLVKRLKCNLGCVCSEIVLILMQDRCTACMEHTPHTPHSLIKWATDHRITLSRTKSRVRQAPPVPEDRSDDRGIKGIPRLRAAPSSFSSTITNTAHGGWTPGPDSVQASRSEWLILPAKCGACVQHDKRAVIDRSLIDSDRGTTVNPTIRPCLVSNSFPHLVTFPHSNYS